MDPQDGQVQARQEEAATTTTGQARHRQLICQVTAPATIRNYILLFSKKAQVDNGRELKLIENVLFLSPKQFPLAMVKSYRYNNKNI
jgi:hypothetical protein